MSRRSFDVHRELGPVGQAGQGVDEPAFDDGFLAFAHGAPHVARHFDAERFIPGVFRHIQIGFIQ